MKIAIGDPAGNPNSARTAAGSTSGGSSSAMPEGIIARPVVGDARFLR